MSKYRAIRETAELRLVIPMEPPSANHYKKPRRTPMGISWYHTAETKAWFDAVAVFAHGQRVEGKEHELEVTVYLGTGSRGDADNFLKVCADGLVRAGVLASDDSITDVTARKRRDRDHPRTEIVLRRVA